MNKSKFYKIDMNYINEMAEKYAEMCEDFERTYTNAAEMDPEYLEYLQTDEAIEKRDQIYDDLEEYLVLCLRDYDGTPEEYDTQIREGLTPAAAPYVWDLLSYILGD